MAIFLVEGNEVYGIEDPGNTRIDKLKACARRW
jgi:hypothetical protein